MIPISTIFVARAAIAAVGALGSVALSMSDASAASQNVMLACAADYYSYCSQHPVDGPSVRRCMRAHGPQLSKGCISALIGDGEVSKAEVKRRVAFPK